MQALSVTVACSTASRW